MAANLFEHRLESIEESRAVFGGGGEVVEAESGEVRGIAVRFSPEYGALVNTPRGIVARSLPMGGRDAVDDRLRSDDD
jgi:hypothetical protein